MKNFHINTPLLESVNLGKLLGKEVWLKMDALQPTGSFKIRGMGRACQEAVKAGATELFTSSGGNAGYAVAYAGNKLRIKTTVIVPQTTSEFMHQKLKDENAEVMVYGESWIEAHEFAKQLCKERHGAYIHPFDDPNVWSGNSTIIDEVKEEIEKPELIIVSVGGGGLLCGLIEGLHKHGWSDVPVLAVETEGAASFSGAIKAGKLITLEKIESIAVTLGAKQVTAKALEWSGKHRIIPYLVTDKMAVNACYNFINDHRVLVEPACGASLAAIYEKAEILNEFKSILVIVCGGSGVNLEMLNKWQQKL